MKEAPIETSTGRPGHCTAKRLPLLAGLALTFLAGWALVALVLILALKQEPATALQAAFCPVCLCPLLPGYLQVVSLVVTATPLVMVLLIMVRPQVCALVVWAYGTVVVYWLWALFLMTARCMDI